MGPLTQTKNRGLAAAYWPPFRTTHQCVLEGVDSLLAHDGAELIENYLSMMVRAAEVEADQALEI